MILDIAAEALRVWKADPVRMVRDLFRVEPDAWQVNALRAFADPAQQRIALQACAGPGKSCVLAWCGWNFLLCYSDGVHHPNGACTSMTGDNLKAGLWKELSLWYERSPDVLQKGFAVTGTSIFQRDHVRTWFLDARTFAKTADTEAQGRTLSGLHARAILYLCDESGATPPAVGRAAEQGLGDAHGQFAKILQAGNPISHESMLYESVTAQSHLWSVIRITADPDDPDRTPRKSAEWAREQITLHGRTNPWVMAYILGVFPPTSINALIGPDEMYAAMKRNLPADQFLFAQKRMGIDPARFGDDATVIFPRQGLVAFNPVVMRGADSTQVMTRMAAGKERWGSELEIIDAGGGYHSGIVDQGRLAGINIMEINSSGVPDDAKFANKRAEMQWRAVQWVKGGGALPNVPALVRQAVATTYWLNAKGKIQITEKAQIKALLHGSSPDEWDAFCLTFAVADQPARGAAPIAESMGAHAVTEWDPFSEERMKR